MKSTNVQTHPTTSHGAGSHALPDRGFNQQIAGYFREAAALLEDMGEGNRYRIAAYRRGARVLGQLRVDVGQVHETKGLAGLRAIRWIGASLAAAITEVVTTGQWAQLETLRQTRTRAHVLYASLPGVNAALAERLYEVLGVPNLERLRKKSICTLLERAAGIDPQQAHCIRLMLAGLLALSPEDEEQEAAS